MTPEDQDVWKIVKALLIVLVLVGVVVLVVRGVRGANDYNGKTDQQTECLNEHIDGNYSNPNC